MAYVPLEVIAQKLSRADGHISEINDAIKTFLKSKPYRFEAEPNPDGSKATVRIFTLDDVRLPDAEISVLVGEVVHGLRSALDQLAWALTVTRQRKVPREPIPYDCWWRNVHFPIFISSGKWASGHKAALRGVDPMLWERFKLEQPFSARNFGERDPLWMLHDLWNRDKHRSPAIVLIRPSRLGPKDASELAFRLLVTDRAPQKMTPKLLKHSRRPIKDGDPIIEVGLLTPMTPTEIQNQLYKDHRLRLEVAFEEGGPGNGKPVVGLLNAMRMRTSNIVDAFSSDVSPPPRPRHYDCPDLKLPRPPGKG